MVLVSYVLLALTWGSSFLLMKLALEDFSPGAVATGRLVLGALTLLLVMLASRRRWPRDPRLLGHLVVVGFFLCALPFMLFAWAAQFLPSGLAAILNATTPLWTALLTSVAIREERMTPPRLLGLIVGAIGVGVVMGVWEVVRDPAFLLSIPAQLTCLGATASYGIAFTWMRRFITGRHDADPPTLAAMQVSAAAVLSLLAAPWTVRLDGVPSLQGMLALLVLGCLGTGLAYVWSFRIVASWGPVAASTVTYLSPPIGVVLGVLVLAEPVHWYQPLGALLIIGGIVVAQYRPRARGAESAPAPGGTSEAAGPAEQP